LSLVCELAGFQNICTRYCTPLAQVSQFLTKKEKVKYFWL
jgi:hypothetical protein